MGKIVIVLTAITSILLWGCGEQQPAEKKAEISPVIESQEPENQEPPRDITLDSRESAMEALDDDDLRIRWQAVRYIRGNSDTAFNDLKDLIFKTPHEDVASAAISALISTGTSEEVIPVLIEALNHKFSTARSEAVINLGKFGNEAVGAIEHIEAAMENADARFTEKAREALELIQKQ